MIGNETSENRQLDFSVPQGSIQGAFLFILYASTLQEVVKNQQLNGFADNHSIRTEFNTSKLGAENSTITAIEDTMQKIKR